MNVISLHECTVTLSEFDMSRVKAICALTGEQMKDLLESYIQEGISTDCYVYGGKLSTETQSKTALHPLQE